MRHTLVAAFATTLDANRTRGDLMARGIPREHIHSVGADSAEIHAYDEPYTATNDTIDRDHHDTKVTGFFKSLFGGHEEHYRHHATVYPEVVRRGGLVIAVDVYSDDELARVRDSLEYNNAIDISDPSGKYAGISSSPYVGATGGDTHLDTHRDHLDRYKDDPEKLRELRRNEQHYQQRTGAAGSSERYSESERPGAGGPIGSAAGSGRTSDDASSTGYGDSRSANTGRYDVGSAGKRAGTDYPSTTATSQPTGGGTTGYGSSVGTSDVGRTSASDVGGESRVGSSGTGTGSMGSSSASSQNATGSNLGEGSDSSVPRGDCGDRVCIIRRSDNDTYPR